MKVFKSSNTNNNQLSKKKMKKENNDKLFSCFGYMVTIGRETNSSWKTLQWNEIGQSWQKVKELTTVSKWSHIISEKKKWENVFSLCCYRHRHWSNDPTITLDIRNHATYLFVLIRQLNCLFKTVRWLIFLFNCWSQFTNYCIYRSYKFLEIMPYGLLKCLPIIIL